MDTEVQRKPKDAMDCFNDVTQLQLMMSECRLTLEHNVTLAKDRVKKLTEDVGKMARVAEKLALKNIEDAASKRRRDLEAVNLELVDKIVPKLFEAVNKNGDSGIFSRNGGDITIGDIDSKIRNVVNFDDIYPMTEFVDVEPDKSLANLLATPVENVINIKPKVSSDHFNLTLNEEASHIGQVELTVSIESKLESNMKMSPFLLADFVVTIKSDKVDDVERVFFGPTGFKDLSDTKCIKNLAEFKLQVVCPMESVEIEMSAVVNVEFVGEPIKNSPARLWLKRSPIQEDKPTELTKKFSSSPPKIPTNDWALDQGTWTLKKAGFLEAARKMSDANAQRPGNYTVWNVASSIGQRGEGGQEGDPRDQDLSSMRYNLSQVFMLTLGQGHESDHLPDVAAIKSATPQPLPQSVTRDLDADIIYVSDVGNNVIHFYKSFAYKGLWQKDVKFIAPRYVLCIPPIGVKDVGNGKDVLVLDQVRLHHFDVDGNERHPHWRILDGEGHLYRGLAYYNLDGYVITMQTTAVGVSLVFIDMVDTLAVVKKISLTGSDFKKDFLARSMCRFLDVWNDFVYVSDLGLGWVYEVNLSNGSVKHFCTGSPLQNAMGICFDPAGNIVVAVSDETRDEDGNLTINGRLDVLGPRGWFCRSLQIDCRRPVGLCFDGEHFFVTDIISRSVKVFKINEQQ